jgi:exodeoxyribonuclease VII large subunit
METRDVLEVSVAEFSRRFITMIAKHSTLQHLAVIGELSEVNRWSGHLSLTLKEGDAILKCFAFESESRAFPEVVEGVAVRVEGFLELRPNWSGYQLHVTQLSLAGAGEEATQIERLRGTLRAEGAFDPARRREIPPFPRSVALISADGQARADFEQRLRRDVPNVRVVFIQTRVQGKGAEIEIAEAMDRASREAVDVVVLTRGGGSNEDRITFNREAVVRAILRSKHPVITALGHLKNRHLADDVADLAVDTPTSAAVKVAAEWVRAFERISTLRGSLDRSYRSLLSGRAQVTHVAGLSLERALERSMTARRERLQRAIQALERRNPATRLSERRGKLREVQTALGTVRREYFAVARRRVERAADALERESPKRPLERGYAMLTKGGALVRDTATIEPGDEIVATLARGALEARVERVSHE